MQEANQLLLAEVLTPTLPVWPGVLVVPIVGILDTFRMNQTIDNTLNEVVRVKAQYCILDITGARVIDDEALVNLTRLVKMLKLVGAEPIVTGVGPAAAQSLVELQAQEKNFTVYHTLAEALARIIQQSRRYQ